MSEVNPASFGDVSMLKTGDALARAESFAEQAFTGEAQTTTQVETKTEPDPVQTTQAVEQVVQAPSQGKVLEVSEDALVRVKIDGEIKEVPYKEFKDSLQREAAWHQRQQKFAEARRQVEQQYAAQFAELEKNARLVQAYEQELKSKLFTQPQQQQPQVPASKPDEIATLQEVRQEAERVGQSIDSKIAARDQQFKDELQKVANQLRQEQISKQNQAVFNNGLNKVLTNDAYKNLDVIPNLEQNLRWEVAKLQPESLEEAIEFADKIAKDWSSKLRQNHITEQQKADAARAKAKMEPSDGSPPRPTQTAKPKSFMLKNGKLDHNALREAALALLD